MVVHSFLVRDGELTRRQVWLERYHRSMKNRILLQNYYLPGQLEHSIDEFVEYYLSIPREPGQPDAG
jgi:hypothetical protein